jgi:mannose-1-phosphate guanylyltransferase
VVIAWNGDILFAPDLGPLLVEHRASGVAATMLLLPMPSGRSYGVVEIDAGGRVQRIGRPGPMPLPGCTAWHFSGVHLLSPRVFEAMSAEGPEDINHDVYPRLFEEGAVRGVVVEAPWSDLGSPATYLEAQADLLLGRVPDPLGLESPLAGRTGRAPLVEPGAQVHPRASLAPDVFVAAGVEVPDGSRVRGSALLAGASVGPGETVDGEIRWSGQTLRSY